MAWVSSDIPIVSQAELVNVDIGHRIEDMICDLGQDSC